MKRQSSRPTSGFTLLEVVISMGLFAFAIVVIVGSLVTAGGTAGNDARRSQGVELLHRCFGELRLAGELGCVRSPDLGLEPVIWGDSPVTRTLWFDPNGALTTSDQRAFFKCEINATRDESARLGHLHGRIVWPVGRQAGNVELFTSMLLP